MERVVGVATGDIIRIDATQELDTVMCMNSYFYRYYVVAGATDDIYPAVVDWFESNVMAAHLAFASTALDYRNVTVRNITNGVDIYQRDYNEDDQQGSVGGDFLPSYAAYSFILRRSNLLTRNGYKRYAGIPESQGAGNAYTPGSTLAGNMVTALLADIVIGATPTFSQIILKHPYTVPLVSPVYSDINSASFQRITTQNSRKD